ncbi:hypothetical protein RUM44_010005 [Polyplax serrata]|uniref:Uncharacterized protein n=1 Tax=Polyplax serrata TaxID=468196 RepID=A0ABR1AW47_POLSC
MKKGELRRGRSSESLEKSPKGDRREQKFALRREKSLSLTRERRQNSKDRKEISRESSTSSVGREVRCACQYFQSDKLLPERITLFGSRPLSTYSDMAKSYGEHVYEPINPLPSPPEPKQAHREVEAMSSSLKDSSIPDSDQKLAKVPSEKDITKKMKDTLKSASKESEELEPEIFSTEFGSESEEKYEEPTTSGAATSPSTSPSPKVHKGILKTTGIKDIPIKHSTLGTTRREQMRAQAQDIQEKLRNHAGRIRTKFNNMQRSSFRRKKSAETNETEEKPKFHLPEMHAPKISLLDRSKFKFPEKAKLHLPDKSKFHLPESAKLHLPDTSKFHLPERPKFNLAEKIHLPEGKKLHLPERPKMPKLPKLPDTAKLHLPDRSKLRLSERAKMHLPSRAKLHIPEKAKLRLPDKSKFHLPERPKFHLPEKATFNFAEKLNRPRLDISKLRRSRDVETPSTSSGSKFELKSYPKLFSKHSKDYVTSSPKQTRGRTPPPRMKAVESRQQKAPEKWNEKMDDLQYADDDLEEDMTEMNSRKDESLFDYREKDLQEFEDGLQEDSEDAAHLSKKIRKFDSYDRKKGVLEEINSDEYFLRQKGISQDDIDMGKYLSHEIREAFRSPDVNALVKMDYMDDENMNPDYRPKPVRPKRAGSAKKKSKMKKTSRSDPSLSDDGYKTYPPRRPGRKSRSQSKSLLNEDGVTGDSSVAHFETSSMDDPNMSKYDNMDLDEDNLSEYYKTPGPALEYEHYKTPRSHGFQPQSPPAKRKSSLVDEFMDNHIQEALNEFDKLLEPPVPMARTKSKKKKKKQEQPVESRYMRDEGEEEKLDSTSFFDEQIPKQTVADTEEFLPHAHDVESAVPPKKTRSLGSKSFLTEEELSCGFHSEPEKENLDGEVNNMSDGVCVREGEDDGFLPRSDSGFMPSGAERIEITNLDDAGFGYATVGKPTVTKPNRQKKKKEKPERPPPPRRKKDVSVPIYNTYPRRVPVRPLRNYSTLGPSRPPRRIKAISRVQSLAEKPFRTYAEIDAELLRESRASTEVSGSGKDLQTSQVIEKMKGRPLPPPPRPPRQKSKGPDDPEPTEEEQIALSILRDEEFPVGKQVANLAFQQPAERELVEEICASTQTDALPDDFSFETEDITGLMHEFTPDHLKIQQAFLDEMKREEEELRRRGEVDQDDSELKAEVMRQIEDIIAEEKRTQDDKKMSEGGRADSWQNDERRDQKKADRSHLDVDADMGYASLDRKGNRQEPTTSDEQQHVGYASPEKKGTRQEPTTTGDHQPMGYATPERKGCRQEPSATGEQHSSGHLVQERPEKLQVRELEAETISVHEIQADQIFVKELQSNRVSSQDIDNTGGNIVLGNINLPQSFIDQIVAKIPWEKLKEAREQEGTQGDASTSSRALPPVRPQRRTRGPQALEDSDEEHGEQPRKSQGRRHHRSRHSSCGDNIKEGSSSDGNITELSLQLARACTAAGVETVKNFVNANVAIARSLDIEMCVQVVLCIAIALIAAFFLFGFDAKIIHLNRWDFQFPPQPPSTGV